MIHPNRLLLAVAVLCASSLHATVSIGSFTPAVSSPQPLGTQVTWTATATDSGAGLLTFQYSVSYGSGAFSILRDFASGTLTSGTWTGHRFRLARDLWRGHLSRQGDRQGFPVRRNGNRLRGFRAESFEHRRELCRLTHGQSAGRTRQRTGLPCWQLDSAHYSEGWQKFGRRDQPKSVHSSTHLEY